MVDAQYRVMARFLSQVFESTSGTCEILSQCVSKIHTATQKGSITRAYDNLDLATVGLCIGMVLAMLVLAVCVWSYVTEKREIAARRMPCNPYPYSSEATIVEIQTRNLRKV